MTDEDPRKFYELVHPGAPHGIVLTEPKLREQDKEALPEEGYIVVFFPKIDCLGPAQIGFLNRTLSQSAEAARVKFMDRIVPGQTWETYAHAGHRVRRVRIIDLGDA